MAVHVRADDVHLVGPGRPDLRAIHLFTRARRRRLLVELSQSLVRLLQGIGVDAGPIADAAGPAAAFDSRYGVGIGRRPWRRRRWRRVERVLQTLGRTTVAFQLRF